MGRPTRPAMGGLLDFIEGGGGGISWFLDKFRSNDNTSTQVDCINEANAKVADLDARWYGLAQNWHPTGTYVPADISKILQTGIVALQQAKVVVILSPYSTSDASTVINQAVTDIDKQVADSIRFDNAMKQGQASGIAVSAPDLKDWLVQSLLTASNAFVVRSVLECNTTWLDQADYYLTQAYNVAVQIQGIVADAATAVINTVGGAFDAAKFVTSYAKYGFLAAGAYFAYQFYKKHA